MRFNPHASVASLTLGPRSLPGALPSVSDKSNTRITELLVFLMSRTFARNLAADGGKCLRRNTSPLLRALPLALALLLALTACSGDPPTGPVEIRYGRDTCDLCHMIISDPRFAAQIRGGPGHKAYKFDDIGDGLLFLARQDWKDAPGVEIWVMDVDTGTRWLDARKAFYVPGMQSPMAHGFGAVSDQRPGAVTYEEMRERALKRAARAYCLPGSEGSTRP